MDVQDVDWFHEGDMAMIADPEVWCHCSTASPVHTKLKSQTSQAYLWPCQHLDGELEEQNSSAREKQEPDSDFQDFQGKQLNWPQAKLHNSFSISTSMHTSPPLDAGFVFKDSDSVHGGVKK